VRLLILALLLGSCFDPEELDGALRCAPASGCPGGFECRADLRCWRRGGGPPPDAAYDAPPPLPACSNGIDDDCDGKIDREDPGCTGGDDDDEHGTRQCDDGVDNDGDGKIDYRAPSCRPPDGDDRCDKPDDDSER